MICNFISSFVLYKNKKINFENYNDNFLNDTLFKQKNLSHCGVNNFRGGNVKIIKPELNEVICI